MDVPIECVTLPMACRMYSVHRNTLYKMIKSGRLKAVKPTGTKTGTWSVEKAEMDRVFKGHA